MPIVIIVWQKNTSQTRGLLTNAFIAAPYATGFAGGVLTPATGAVALGSVVDVGFGGSG